MAFDVAPTSGVGPYVFTATFIDKELIDDVNYSLVARFTTSQESCPTEGVTTALNRAFVNSLLSTGTASHSLTVSGSTCRAYTISILRNKNSVVVSSATVLVNNL